MFIAPTQVKILPIADRHNEFCEKLMNAMKDQGIRCEMDTRTEKTGYKIREAQLQKIPYMLVIGDNEVNDNIISVRSRDEGDMGTFNPDEFIAKCPKSVVQNVWYYFSEYGEDIDEKYRVRIMPFDLFEKAGFDQMPAGSIEYKNDCLPKLVDYCTDHISKEHLLGFMQTTWEPMMPKWQDYLDRGNTALAEAKRVFDEKTK
jgi:hypothetical protein